MVVVVCSWEKAIVMAALHEEAGQLMTAVVRGGGRKGRRGKESGVASM